jgi:hypothetical protein
VSFRTALCAIILPGALALAACDRQAPAPSPLAVRVFPPPGPPPGLITFQLSEPRAVRTRVEAGGKASEAIRWTVKYRIMEGVPLLTTHYACEATLGPGVVDFHDVPGKDLLGKREGVFEHTSFPGRDQKPAKTLEFKMWQGAPDAEKGQYLERVSNVVSCPAPQ